MHHRLEGFGVGGAAKMTKRVSRQPLSPSSAGAANPTRRTRTPANDWPGSRTARVTNSAIGIGTAPRTGADSGGKSPSPPPGTTVRLEAA